MLLGHSKWECSFPSSTCIISEPSALVIITVIVPLIMWKIIINYFLSCYKEDFLCFAILLRKNISSVRWMPVGSLGKNQNFSQIIVRPSLVYYLFPIPMFSKTEAGGRWLLIICYANEPMQSVVYIRFNNFLNTFHYHCNA